MKKLFFTALIAVSVSISASAQSVNQVDQKVVDNFEATYGGASNVEWTLKQNFTIASFVRDGRKVEVFFNTDGDFVATTTPVDIEEVPAFVKKIIQSKYNDFTVTETFKLKSYDETSYFLSVENNEEKIVLKVNEGSVSVFSKTGKK